MGVVRCQSLWEESHKARPNDAMVGLEYGSVDHRRAHTSRRVLAGPRGEPASQAFRAHVGSIQARFELGDDAARCPISRQQRIRLMIRMGGSCTALHPRDPLQRRWALYRLNGREPAGEGLRRGPSPVSPSCTTGERGWTEAAIRGGQPGQVLIQRAVELAPNNAEYRETFSRIPMNTMGWISDEPLSPDPAAAP